AIVAPLPRNRAIDAFFKGHSFFVSQIVNCTLRAGLLVKRVVKLGSDVFHHLVIFPTGFENEVGEELHVDIAAAGNVIYSARLEAFADIGQRSAGVINVSESPMVIGIYRIREISQGAIDELTDNAAIVTVRLAGSVGIEQAHGHGLRTVHGS